jgi:hypothetical protein
MPKLPEASGRKSILLEYGNCLPAEANFLSAAVTFAGPRQI